MFKNYLLLSLIFCSLAFSGEKKYLIRIENELGIYYEESNSLKVLTKNNIAIVSASWSPDGKYIAYGLTKNYQLTDLLIIDEEGKEILRIPLNPLKEDKFENWDIRFVFKIEWLDKDLITVDSDIGPHGGLMDIIRVNFSSNSYNHIKRFEFYWCGDCSVSPKLEKMVCGCCGYDEIPQEGKQVDMSCGISLFDLNKKEFPDKKNFCDPEPKPIEFDSSGGEELKFISDDEFLIKRGEDEFYIYNLKEDKLEKVKKLPKEIKLKEFPKLMEIKIGEKKYKLSGLAGSHDIFDVYE